MEGQEDLSVLSVKELKRRMVAILYSSLVALLIGIFNFASRIMYEDVYKPHLRGIVTGA